MTVAVLDSVGCRRRKRRLHVNKGTTTNLPETGLSDSEVDRLRVRIWACRFRVKKRLDSLDNDCHVRPEVCLILNAESCDGCQLSKEHERKRRKY